MGDTGKLDRKTIPVIKKLYAAPESNSSMWGRWRDTDLLDGRSNIISVLR
jgi:hypothetical protein